MTLTTAQRRAYQQISDAASGRMLVIAMDQRASMKSLIQGPPERRRRPTSSPRSSTSSGTSGTRLRAVLLDPETVVPQVVDDGILARDCALMVGMDATGFDIGEGGLRESRIVRGRRCATRPRARRDGREAERLHAPRPRGRRRLRRRG